MSERNGQPEGNLAELPPGWCWTTLATIADIDGGITKDQKRHRTPTMREVPYLRVANVQRSYLDLQEMKTILAEDTEIAAMRLLKGDVLFTEGGDRDKLGRGWVWNGEIEECIHQNHIFRARLCLPLVEPKFVSLHGNFFGQRWFASTGKQTTNLASINKGVLSRFPVPLAPLNEQRRIVAKIEELFSDLDAGVAALVRIKANLKRYRAAVLKAAVEGKLTEEWRAKHPKIEPASKLLERILAERRKKWEKDQLAKFAAAEKTPPKGWREKYTEPAAPDTSGLPQLQEGWCWASASVVCQKIQDGTHFSPSEEEQREEGSFPYVTAKNVRPWRLDLSKLTYLEEAVHRPIYNRCDARFNDVLLVKDGVNAGDAAVNTYPGEISLLSSVAMMRPVEAALTSHYLLTYLQSPLGNRQLLGNLTGTAIRRIILQRIREIPIPIPPLDEQIQIANEVAVKLSQIEAAEVMIDHSQQRAARLRQSILKRAFEGKLVPQDPTDEPAEKLLERIRQERTERNGSVSPKGKPGRGRARTTQYISE